MGKFKLRGEADDMVLDSHSGESAGVINTVLANNSDTATAHMTTSIKR